MINLSTDDSQTQGGNKSVKLAGSLSKVNNRKHHTGVAQYSTFKDVKVKTQASNLLLLLVNINASCMPNNNHANQIRPLDFFFVVLVKSLSCNLLMNTQKYVRGY